ncbi:MAG: phosphoglucosamine mutase [Halobacteriaceae archaeon]
MELFGSSGVRGVANEAVGPELACRVAGAAAATLDADRVALARDTRVSGAMLADAAASGLASAGADADRVGVLPTPGLSAYARREGVPGVMVTASHNPPEYNGIKLIDTDGGDLPVATIERIEDSLDGFGRAAPDAVGESRRVEGARRAYVEAVLADTDRGAIADADLTVALDPGHGAGAHTSPRLFRELGCRVVTVNADPDGRFPGRDPEPTPDALGDLRALVRAADADLGIAHDGDADRAVFVDETGEAVSGDAALAALAAAELDAGDVAVSAVNASRRLAAAVEDRGARLELTPIGATHITARVRELREDERVPVAGEGNGGVFFPERSLARDGAYTAARFLELVTERPASEVVAPHGGYHAVRETVGYESEAERAALLEAAAAYADDTDGEVTTTDGYRLDFEDAWVLVRPSGTEPLVRVTAEARDPDRARDLADGALDALDAAES